MKRLTCWIIIFLLPFLLHAQVWKGTDFTKDIFYQIPGSITLQLNNFMFSGRKVATPPLNFITEVTLARNLTAGPMFTYFQFKRSEFEAINTTRWINPEIRYHEMMIGLKAEYHINSVIESIIRKRIPPFVDTYAAGWLGYSFVKPNSSLADEDLVNSNETVRGGVGLGARSLVLKWMGFSLEGGYSSYGYCSFGLFFVAR